MMDAGANLADINLADIAADPNFDDVLSSVTSIIEAGGDPTESAVVQQVVEDFLSPPAPAPTPTPTPTYTVTFDKNDADAAGTMAAQTIASGSSASLTTCGFTKTGWIFAGWATISGGAVEYADNASYTMGTANVTLYAKWTPTYTVTFNSQGGTAVSSQTVDHGGKATEPTAPTKTGYTFGGWYKELECTNAWDFNTDTVIADVTLYAQWTINTYTVDFNSQGGSPVSSQTVDHGGKATEPTAPTKTGYLFDGWYEESGCINAWDFDTDTVTSDVTLYAKWTIDRYVSKSGNNADIGSADYPWLTIQHALDSAPGGGTVHVADGIYTENISFPSDKVIVLKSENGASSTEINGGNISSVVIISSCPDGTTLDGFTITGGDGLCGGGIYIHTCSPTIQNNTISENTALYDSGGISIIGGSPTIQYNTISENSASGSGGGIYIHTCSPTIEYNTISGNTAASGGGIYMHNSSSSIEDNTISGNTATRWGGGIYISGGSPGPDILYNTISVNTANTEGGGIYIINCSPSIQGNTVCSNTLAQIYDDSSYSYPNNDISTHCDIIGQTGPAGGLVFYDKGYVSDGWRYLEAAPASTEWTSKEWGSYETLIGGTETDIGDGQSNTTKIVTWLNNNLDNTYGDVEYKTDRAAYLCDALTEGSYSDWFLPSKDELNLMYTNLHVEGDGDFVSDIYWSSSEGSPTIAWAQTFSNGGQGYYTKSNGRRVRAIRAY
jgi:uncharacterized repeat protein (TIGR02543 family)